MDDSEDIPRDPVVDDIDPPNQAPRSEVLDTSNPVVPILADPTAPTDAAAAKPNDDEPTAPNEEAAAQSDNDEPAAPNDAAAAQPIGDDAQPQVPATPEEIEKTHMCLAMNEAYQHLIDDMAQKAERALRENRHKQRVLMERKEVLDKNKTMLKRKVPVSQFLPPYFKDEYNMCAPQNAEAKAKDALMVYDPLLREEKKWSMDQLRKLHEAVRNQKIEQALTSIYGQRELVLDKIREANATTTLKERAEWTRKLEAFQRKIDYEKSLPDDQVLTGGYDNIDWATIAMQSFKGLRSPISLQAKWLNEQDPKWNKANWTAPELQKLFQLAKKKEWGDRVPWPLVADQLGTHRTPWQCFVKFKSEIMNEILKRPWTKEEDGKLVQLVTDLQLNGAIQWDKVTYHMAPRTRQQCRTRYLRTLDKAIRHGKWTDEEDLLLMCSIGRYGAKDWRKIAVAVPGRNDGQCRERWVNVLDRANKSLEWTMEEDERLLYAVNIFGKDQWAKIATLLPGRSPQVCKARFRNLLSTKMRICVAQLQKLQSAEAAHMAKPDRRPFTIEEFKEYKANGGRDERHEPEPDRMARIPLAFAALRRAEPRKPVSEARVVVDGLQGKARGRDNSIDYGRQRRWSEMSDGELFGSPVRRRFREKKEPSLPPLEIDTEITEIVDPSVKKVKDEDPDEYDEDRPMSSKTAAEIDRRKAEARAKKEKEMKMEEPDEYEERPITSKAAAATSEELHPTAAAAKVLLAELPRIAVIAAPLLSKQKGKPMMNMGDVQRTIEESFKHHKEYQEMRDLARKSLAAVLARIHALSMPNLAVEFIMKQFKEASEYLTKEVEKPRRKVSSSIPSSKTASSGIRKTRQESMLKPKLTVTEQSLAQRVRATPAPITMTNKRRAPSPSEGGEEKAKKEPPVKRGRGRPRKSVAPPPIDSIEAEDTVEEEEKEEETVVPAAKSTPVRSRKSVAFAADVAKETMEEKKEEEEGGDEKAEMETPSTQRRSSRARGKSVVPPLADDVKEEEMVPLTKRLSGRRGKSVAPPPADDAKETMDKKEEAEGGEDKEEMETPSTQRRSSRRGKSVVPPIDKEKKVATATRGRGRPRKSTAVVPATDAKEEEKEEEKKEEEKKEEEKEEVEKKEDTVAGQEEAHASDDDTIPALLEEAVTDAKEVPEEKKDAEEDTVATSIDSPKDTVSGQEDAPKEAIPHEE